MKLQFIHKHTIVYVPVCLNQSSPKTDFTMCGYSGLTNFRKNEIFFIKPLITGTFICLFVCLLM